MYKRKPEWLRISLKSSEDLGVVEKTLGEGQLTTVCREAKCPNLHECWGRNRTATFMVLGDVCTRRCRFCSVATGLPKAVDYAEIDRVLDAVGKLELKHVVITMVNRDDLADGGSLFLAELISRIKQEYPKSTLEILSSDMMGNVESIERMMAAGPDIMSHNLETVRRLTPLVRSRSDYDRSLFFLKAAAACGGSRIKSSIMLGLGETKQEIVTVMDDLLENGVEVMNIGQYLQPTKRNIPVEKYWTPEEFAGLKQLALDKGFAHCESGPLVRSSYMAADNPLLAGREG